MRPRSPDLRVSRAPARRPCPAPGHEEVRDECCFVRARHHDWAAVAFLVLTCWVTPVAAGSLDSVQTLCTASGAAPAWPCRLVIARTLRPSVEARLDAVADVPVAVRAARRRGRPGAAAPANAVQTRRRAQSLIGSSADGIRSSRVLIRVSADTVELIAHELEHVLEHLEGVNLSVQASRHRSGVTMEVDAYETDRAIEVGQRVAREVRDSVRSAQ